MTAPLSRRRALTSAATLGVGVPLLAACGDDGASSATDDATTEATTSSAPTSATTTETADDATSTAAATGALVATADVPVGGGVILADEEMVVTQPTAGDYKAFSAICTHQGCLVSSVGDGRIRCACHGSSFAVTDGSVTGGPAPSALAAVAVKVDGDQVVRG